ncbi:ABC transporter substrate binding protein [Gottschalkia acidurici 9a]|uniref:ABC transporter substrate binding protein n=1 Tax=Gottschalkia acidurici (strain ATCC 7906 / DSM 604 / BCRC 14475 / CIP 104303 / KCTC 5404 / NCIMB 10678 / 9a) TaxID=1128398 RepID=K0AXA3_GOTA9|nr:ABC transporter substrate-binding protein [Gottschalkia acidurici]AFS77370.1 ABC transporter substrate binding protein [Gottschalkia acidurici 9a]
MVNKFKRLGKKAVALALTSALAGTMLVGCGNGSTDTSEKASNNNAQDKVIKIGISQVISHGALDSTREGFVAALEEKGYRDGEKIKIDLQNAQGDSATMQTIAQNFVADKKDLLLGIGTPSAQALYNATKDTPILITAVTDPVGAGLTKSMEKPETNVTGTSDALDLKLQFELLKKLAPNAKNIGVLYTTSESNSEVQLKEIKAKAPEFGFKIVEAGVATTNDVAQSLEHIIGKIDAMYIPTDNIIVNSMPLIYSKTIDKKIPIIGSEKGQVENGALATEGIDYYKLGYQTGLMAVEILEGKKPADMPVQTANEYILNVNKETLGKLSIELPEELKAKAEMIGSVKGD